VKNHLQLVVIIIIIIIIIANNKRAKAETRNTGTIHNQDRIAATMCPLGTWIFSGIRIWIPCMKQTTTTIQIVLIIIYNLLEC
jgi:hypothetical protein